MTERLGRKEPELKYPEHLVQRYGAKAGILLYVAQRLPDIPQAKMVVNEKGESTEEFLERADNTQIDWPRIFRSSAAAELTGYEGVFSTFAVEPFEIGHDRVKWNDQNYSIFRNEEYFARGIRETVEKVKNSPQNLKKMGKGLELPDQINVIIAEKAPSVLVGTYIKHPNKEGAYVITMTTQSTMSVYGEAANPERVSFLYDKNNGFIRTGGGAEYLEQDLNELEEAISWHDKISSLPDMDPSWAYQVEFGINPSFLFQVRPFKPYKKPTFELKPTKYSEIHDPIVVFGTTPSKGLVLRVVNSDSPIIDEPCVYVDDMRTAWKGDDYPNLQANLLTRAPYGFLQHGDVRAVRRTEVTGFYATSASRIKPGKYIRIKSDGERIKVTKVKRKTAEVPPPQPDFENIVDHLKVIYAHNPVLLGKLENYAEEYASVQGPEITIWERKGKLTAVEAEIEGKHDLHFTSWKSGEWNCDCDMFHGRGKFEDMYGECSHTMTVRILAAKRGYQVLLPSEQEQR